MQNTHTVSHKSVTTGIKAPSIAGAANPTQGLQSNQFNGVLGINRTGMLVRKYLTMSSAGNISLHSMHSFAMQTNARLGAFTTLTVFVQTTNADAFMSKVSDTKQALAFPDGNAGAIKRIMETDSPYTAIIVNACISETFIPASRETWDNIKHNSHAEATWKLLKQIEADASIIAEDKTAEFTKAWDKYNELEAALKAHNLLIPSNILVAEPNSVNPSIVVFQNTRAPSNQLLDSAHIYGNPAYEASYAPNNNSIVAVAQKLDLKENSHNGYQYGLIAIRKQKTDAVQLIDITDKETLASYQAVPTVSSSLMKLSDHVGRSAVIQMVMPDTNSGGFLVKRSITFEEIAPGQTLFVMGKLVPRNQIKATLSVIFEIRDATYTVQHNAMSNSITGDISVSSDMTDDASASLYDMSFEDVFDATASPAVPANAESIAPASVDEAQSNLAKMTENFG